MDSIKTSSRPSFVFKVLSTAVIALLSAVTPMPAESVPHNLLLVTIDTLRPDRLGCYGGAGPATPHIDAWAARGVLFKRAFAHTSTTLPSHTNILTGTTPLAHGVHDNNNFLVPAESLTLAEFLKTAGWATGAFVGAFPLDSRFGLDQGFDVYDDEFDPRDRLREESGERVGALVLSRALTWLESRTAPWFCWIHLYDPHDPYQPPEPFLSRFQEAPYDGEVAYVDYVLGKLDAFLERKKLHDKTLLIFTGDHGESLGEHGEDTHGFFAYNSTIHIPLIMAAPGINPGIVNHPVSHIDLFPTVCDLLRMPLPKGLQGDSLAGALNGKRPSGKPIYFESLYPYYCRGWAPLSGMIEKGWKYIETPIPELYDLERDFPETRNLAPEKNLDDRKRRFQELTAGLSEGAASGASRRADRRTLEKLRTMGYISDAGGVLKKEFGPSEDVKILLPYHNRCMRAMELFKSGRSEAAAEELKRVIAERSDVNIAYIHLAQIYWGLEREGDALQVLKLGLEAVENNYEILYTTVQYLMEAGVYREVIELLEEGGHPAMDIDPEIWNILGLAYWFTRNLDKAESAYLRAIELDGGFAMPRNNLGTLHLRRWREIGRPSDLEAAAARFAEAVRIDPDYVTALTGLGAALLEKGELDAAVQRLDRALELRPDSGDALFNLGIALCRLEKFSRALEIFARYRGTREYARLSAEGREQVEAWVRRCRDRKPKS